MGIIDTLFGQRAFGGGLGQQGMSDQERLNMQYQAAQQQYNKYAQGWTQQTINMRNGGLYMQSTIKPKKFDIDEEDIIDAEFEIVGQKSLPELK